MKITDLKKLIKTIKEEHAKILSEGASTLGGIFKGNENQLKMWFNKKQHEDRREYGNDPYGASWASFEGLRIVDQKFKDEREARHYVDDNTEKWGPAMAVKAGKDTVWYVGGWVAESIKKSNSLLEDTSDDTKFSKQKLSYLKTKKSKAGLEGDTQSDAYRKKTQSLDKQISNVNTKLGKLNKKAAEDQQKESMMEEGIKDVRDLKAAVIGILTREMKYLERKNPIITASNMVQKLDVLIKEISKL